MNDALGRIEALESENRELKERMARIEQQTEQMKVVRVEVASQDVHNRLDNHLELLKAEQHTQAFVRVESMLSEHSRQLEQLTHMAIGMQKSLDAIIEVNKAIFSRLPERGEESE